MCDKASQDARLMDQARVLEATAGWTGSKQESVPKTSREIQMSQGERRPSDRSEGLLWPLRQWRVEGPGKDCAAAAWRQCLEVATTELRLELGWLQIQHRHEFNHTSPGEVFSPRAVADQGRLACTGTPYFVQQQTVVLGRRGRSLVASLTQFALRSGIRGKLTPASVGVGFKSGQQTGVRYHVLWPICIRLVLRETRTEGLGRAMEVRDTDQKANELFMFFSSLFCDCPGSSWP